MEDVLLVYLAAPKPRSHRAVPAPPAGPGSAPTWLGSQHRSDELHCSRGHQRGDGLVADQVLRALLQIDGVLPARGRRGIKLLLLGRCVWNPAHSACRRTPYLCSSVSGSTRMFSCLSSTLKKTKESRLGFGTVETVGSEHRLSTHSCSSAGCSAQKGAMGTSTRPIKGMLDNADQG